MNAQTNRTLHTDAEIQAYLDDIVNNKKFRRNGYFITLQKLYQAKKIVKVPC